MTRFGHDPTQNLGHDRDPVMTHNIISERKKNLHGKRPRFLVGNFSLQSNVKFKNLLNLSSLLFFT
jgi:hypothetical protein